MSIEIPGHGPDTDRDTATVAIARRNNRCPCGSGRRYKHCHGSVSSAGSVSSERSAQPANDVAPRPVSVDEQVRRGLQLHQQGDTAAAEGIYRQVLATSDHPVAEHYLGVSFYQRGDLDAALPLLVRSTQRMPAEPDFHLNLGVALLAVGRETEAVESIGKTLRLAPGHAAAHNNLGLALQALNRLPEAIDAFRSAIDLAPGYAEAHWNLSLALLATGAFEEGWREYEWRLKIPRFAGSGTSVVRTELAIATWDGGLRPGLRLLLRAEQGLGDAIQFARFVPSLARRGVCVTLECQPTLHRLFANLDGAHSIVAPGAAPPHEHDAQAHLLSIPSLLGIDRHSIPNAVPYLATPSAAVASWKEVLRVLPGAVKAGIAWAGSRQHANDRNRSCPFDRLLTLASLPQVALVSLQLGELPASVRQSPGIGNIHSFSERFGDMLDTAALIQALDIVVTVDTSIAHLAGALGRPVVVMLPFAPDWRWQLDRNDSPWYPTATLLRQASPRDWESVIARVAEILRAATEQAASGKPPGTTSRQVQ